MAGAYVYMMKTKISRIIKIDVTPLIDSEKRPSEVFHEISREYNQNVTMKDIKREL